MAVTGKFVGMASADLATMKTSLQAAYTAVLLGQSYSIAGRSLSRADLRAISDDLAEVTYAQGAASGDVQRVVYADMSNTAG